MSSSPLICHPQRITYRTWVRTVWLFRLVVHLALDTRNVYCTWYLIVFVELRTWTFGTYVWHDPDISYPSLFPLQTYAVRCKRVSGVVV